MKNFLCKLLKCKSKFEPPRPFQQPAEWPPEINREQYYCYDYYGNGWYMRMFFLGQSDWVKLSQPVPTQQWLNIYPLPNN